MIVGIDMKGYPFEELEMDDWLIEDDGEPSELFWETIDDWIYRNYDPIDEHKISIKQPDGKFKIIGGTSSC
jgi:hypothetical protein